MHAPAIDHHQRIVKTRRKRVEVRASPGSGKTYTLVHRVQYLIAHGVPARDILVLSFSDDAVGEVRRKLDELCTASRSKRVSATVRNVRVQTAHAFALSIVKHSTPDVAVMGKANSRQLLVQAIRRTLKDARAKMLWKSVSSQARKQRIMLLRRLLTEPTKQAHILSALAYTHAANLTPSTTVSMTRYKGLSSYIQVINSVARRYATAKQSASFVDFGDMLARASVLIEHQPKLVRFKHVLIDEYQDNSPAQTSVLKVLAERCGCHLMVFGDRDQAIYGFGGSRYTPLSNVIDGVTLMRLPVSHRLTQEIAALASMVAGHDANNQIVAIKCGALPRLNSSNDLASQTHETVADILNLIQSGTQPCQIAVLARTKAFLKPVEQRLLAHGIATNRLGKTREHCHYLLTLSLVQLVERSVRLGRRIQEASIRHSMRTVKVDEDRWLGALQRLRIAAKATSLEGHYRQCVDAYLHLLGGIRTNEEIRHELRRWEPMCRGYPNVAAARQAFKEIGTVEDSLNSDTAVVTSTIHASKGREWNHVMVVGLADGQLPFRNAREDTQALEEERRTLYVAISRARESLHLYYAPAIDAASGQPHEHLSQFLASPSVLRSVAQNSTVSGLAEGTAKPPHISSTNRKKRVANRVSKTQELIA